MAPYEDACRAKLQAGVYDEQPAHNAAKRGRLPALSGKCLRCGDEFVPRNAQQRYCDVLCVSQASRDRKRAGKEGRP